MAVSLHELPFAKSFKAIVLTCLSEAIFGKTAFVVSDSEQTTLVRLGENVLVKYGPNVRPVEADTLHFILENASFPVPHVHGVYTTDDGVTFIVMQFICGDSLLDIWDTLASDQKKNISDQLHAILKDLRRFSANYIGALGKRPCRDILFEECDDQGPFATEQAMNEAIIQSRKCGWMPPESYVKSTLRSLPNDHEVIFCHGDFVPENIIIDRGQLIVKAIVGWSCAGFFPEYWEFVNALTIQDWESDWVVYAQKILDPYHKEYALWYRIREMAYGI